MDLASGAMDLLTTQLGFQNAPIHLTPSWFTLLLSPTPASRGTSKRDRLSHCWVASGVLFLHAGSLLSSAPRNETHCRSEILLSRPCTKTFSAAQLQTVRQKPQLIVGGYLVGVFFKKLRGFCPAPENSSKSCS